MCVCGGVGWGARPRTAVLVPGSSTGQQHNRSLGVTHPSAAWRCVRTGAAPLPALCRRSSLGGGGRSWRTDVLSPLRLRPVQLRCAALLHVCSHALSAAASRPLLHLWPMAIRAVPHDADAAPLLGVAASVRGRLLPARKAGNEGLAAPQPAAGCAASLAVLPGQLPVRNVDMPRHVGQTSSQPPLTRPASPHSRGPTHRLHQRAPQLNRTRRHRCCCCCVTAVAAAHPPHPAVELKGQICGALAPHQRMLAWLVPTHSAASPCRQHEWGRGLVGAAQSNGQEGGTPAWALANPCLGRGGDVSTACP